MAIHYDIGGAPVSTYLLFQEDERRVHGGPVEPVHVTEFITRAGIAGGLCSVLPARGEPGQLFGGRIPAAVSCEVLPCDVPVPAICQEAVVLARGDLHAEVSDTGEDVALARGFGGVAQHATVGRKTAT